MASPLGAVEIVILSVSLTAENAHRGHTTGYLNTSCTILFRLTGL